MWGFNLVLYIFIAEKSEDVKCMGVENLQGGSNPSAPLPPINLQRDAQLHIGYSTEMPQSEQ